MSIFKRKPTPPEQPRAGAPMTMEMEMREFLHEIFEFDGELAYGVTKEHTRHQYASRYDLKRNGKVLASRYLSYGCGWQIELRGHTSNSYHEFYRRLVTRVRTRIMLEDLQREQRELDLEREIIEAMRDECNPTCKKKKVKP